MSSEIKMVERGNSQTYDFTFIGLGASNSLILLSLLKNKLLNEKTVLIIEPSLKLINDKTYCFWAENDDSIVHDLSPIISCKFEKIVVNNSSVQNISDQPYHYIRSIDLYNYTLQILKREKINILRDEVNSVSEDQNKYLIGTKRLTIETSYIFDSRPPLFKMDESEIYLKQSFFGLHIKCEKSVFDHSSFEMMNFNVDQNSFTQFLYIIPFSEHEALIELTRFGSEEINLEYASQVLTDHISKEYGDYVIIADEKGCIPMTTFINEPSKSAGILNTGTAANLIKPSTGYGFKNMYSFALEVSDRISKDQYHGFNKLNIIKNKRFKFYDTLLLIILLKWPQKGKQIFVRLFEKQSAGAIFKFLDEKTTYSEELKIFSSLPFIPFIRALYCLLKGKKQLRYLFSSVLILMYLLLSQYSIDTAEKFGYTLLSIGLLGIGIPHGAMDHSLVKSKHFSLPFFIMKYSVGILLYYMLWQIFPAFSLIFFIIFSSFHFGESEMVGFNRETQMPIPLFKSFLLGFSILLFIIGTHRDESLKIISYLNLDYDLTLFNSDTLSLLISLLSFGYILYASFYSNRNPHYGLLFLLVLGISAPLILAFGLYFIMQHSNNAWNHVKQGLRTNTIELYKKASFYTFGALTVFAMMILNAESLKSLNALWSQFFIFLACISLPHFVLMHLFYKRFNE